MATSISAITHALRLLMISTISPDYAEHIEPNIGDAP